MCYFKRGLCVVSIMVLSACANKGDLNSTQVSDNKAGVSKDKQHDKSHIDDKNDPIINRFDPTVIDPMVKTEIPAFFQTVYKQSQKLIRQKKYLEAEDSLKQLLANYPTASSPNYHLARLYYSQNQWDKALSSVETLLSKTPHNYYALNLKALILRQQGKFLEAKAAYLLAIKYYSNYPNSHLNLAILADIYLYDLDLALNHYQYYLGLIKVSDKKAEGWVIDLKRRIKNGDKK